MITSQNNQKSRSKQVKLVLAKIIIAIAVACRSALAYTAALSYTHYEPSPDAAIISNRIAARKATRELPTLNNFD